MQVKPTWGAAANPFARGDTDVVPTVSNGGMKLTADRNC
jgi:hypothetical protein